MAVFFVIFLLLFFGLMLLFKVQIMPNEAQINVSAMMRSEKRDLIIQKSPSRLTRMQYRLQHLLALAGVPPTLFGLLSLGAAVAGAVLGRIIFGDLSFAFVFALGALPLPIIYLIMRAGRQAKLEAEQLESLMSSVTHAYLASHSIIAAFESYNNMRIKGMDPRLRKIGPVDEFLIDVHAINPSVTDGLRKLQGKIQNRYFDDWVDMLIRCTKNNELRFGLQPIIKAFNDSKIMQLEAETVTGQVWREYFLVVLMLFGIIPVFRLSNEAWYNILVQTLIGRTLVCIMIVAALGTSFYVLHVTRPLD